MPITMLYFKLSSTLMFNISNNTAPNNISYLFTPTQQIHSYNTRSSSSANYFINYAWLNQQKKSFSVLGAKIWNCIPDNIRNLLKNIFKKNVHTTLFDKLKTQDSYSYLNLIILDFKKQIL